jgi:hypothetical protein
LQNLIDDRVGGFFLLVFFNYSSFLIDAMVNATWNLANVDDESDLTEVSSDEEDVDTPIEHETSDRGPPRQTNSTVPSGSPKKATRLSTQEATQKSKARTKDKWPLPAVEFNKTTTFSASSLYGEFHFINSGTWF